MLALKQPKEVAGHIAVFQWHPVDANCVSEQTIKHPTSKSLLSKKSRRNATIHQSTLHTRDRGWRINTTRSGRLNTLADGNRVVVHDAIHGITRQTQHLEATRASLQAQFRPLRVRPMATYTHFPGSDPSMQQ